MDNPHTATLGRCKRALVTLLAIEGLACSQAASAPGAGGASVPVAAAPATDLFDRPWTWTDDAGESVALSSFRGAPLIVTAIYTSCTERCPLTVEKLRRIDDAFRRHRVDSRVVLVTLDPEHDTLQRLRRFRTEHNMPASWHLLRGDLLETHEIARLLRMNAIYDDGHIDHDVRIAVFDRCGRLARSFTGWSFDENEALVAR